jgi:hypothetical protein
MKKQATAPLEKDVQRAICDWLYQNGYFFWRQNNIPVFGMSNDGKKRFRSLPKYTPKGIPDIFVVHEGKLWGIEVKRIGAEVRPAQLDFGKSMKEHGAIWVVVNTWQEVRDLLTFQPATPPPPVL